MLIRIFLRERMKAKCSGQKPQIAFICIAFFLSLGILPVSFAQDFTATTIGDYGHVTVMEVTGKYDAVNPDQSINSIPREVIAKEFFRTHRDEYDFLFVFSNFDFTMPESEAVAFYLGVRNDTRGIGLPVFDNCSFFGSNGKLQGMVDMGNVAKYVTQPLDPQFEEVLYFMAHELMHRWGAYIKFKDKDGNISTALLGRDGTHWNFLLDSKASVLYGNQWQDNGDGTFTSVGARRYYSPLDLYLMGMYDKSQVPPILLIENPNIDPAKLPEVGTTIQGTARYISIDEIIAAEGERIPEASDSQKKFTISFIFITNPGTFRGDEVYGIENVREGWISRYSILTDGQGVVKVSLAPTEEVPTNPGPPVPPFTPRSIPPNIEDGVKWLMSHQGSGGNWMDLPQTTERDTAETALILKHFDMAKGSYESGTQWLKTVVSGNMDYLSRKIEVFVQAGQDVKGLLEELVSRQNPDGGWGSNANYMSNPTDTSFALKAMAEAGYSDLNIISRAIEYLKSKQSTGGAWGNEDEESSIQSTANVLSAFNRYRQQFQLEENISSGMAWLMSRRNPDGGFGNSPSTIYDTAIAILVLKELGGSTDVIDAGLNYLLNLQSGDGSWFGSPYQTALAVSAVWKATIDADLSIETDEIIFSPPSVSSLPANVTIDATIWNTGRTDVPQAKVVLYDGTPSEANKLAEQVVGFPGQSSVRVSFPVTINHGNDHRFYLSIDPENLVRESNKSNNTALKILYPATTFDFEILPSEISISPNPIDIYREVKITSKITNKGTMNAYNVQVRYFIDDPGGAVDIATVTVDIPAGSAVAKEIIWRSDKAGTDLPVTVSVDPFDLFEEVSEANNKASAYLTVNGSTDPNLALSYQDIVIAPSPVLERGSATISARVSNNGFSGASEIRVSFYKGVPGKDGILIGSQTIPSLSPGEAKDISIEWAAINDSGEKVVYVQVDPDNLIKEIVEDDNGAFVTLKILSLPDLVVSTNSIIFDPPAPKEGDTIAIRVTIRNRGEQNVSNVLIRASEQNQVIGSQVLPSIPGNSQAAASFAFDTTGKSGPHRIFVQVDPENSIVEQSEDNNQAFRDFGVQDANLWVTEKYISPNGDGVKDSTQFFFRLSTVHTVKIAVVNEKGEIVRTFSKPEFENTSDGNVTWDGFNERGLVVDDGQYQLQVIGDNSKPLGRLLVVVDNNRSPLTDALGTKYLLNNNITCMLPDLGQSWKWLPDESGILFHISTANQNTPEYPTGLYTLSPDGEDVFRIIPWEWALGVNPTYDYSIEHHVLSPDGEKVVFIVRKQNKYSSSEGLRQLWIVDRDGRNLVLLDSYDAYQDRIRISLTSIRWSPDSGTIAFFVHKTTYDDYGRVKDYSLEVWIIKPDGTGKTRIDFIQREDSIGIGGFEWSPDGSKIAYVSEADDEDGHSVIVLRINDRLGNKEDIFSLTSLYSSSFVWFTNQKIIFSQGETTWLLNASGGGPHVKLFDYSRDRMIRLAPDRQSFAFTTYIPSIGFPYTIYLNISDADGNIKVVHERAAEGDCCCPYFGNMVWSPDSRKIAFTEGIGHCTEGCYCNEPYVPRLVVIDTATGKEISFSTPEVIDLSTWLSDGISIISSDGAHISMINSETGESIPVVSSVHVPWFEEQLVSPDEHYISYYKYTEPSSICHGRGYSDLWAMSSLLNLTSHLRVTKERTAVILKGIAADLNFEGYQLEYADVKSPEIWNLVAPPSDVPVIDDVFTTWVPPYEGTFYVRLTVWDKAGNVAQGRRRVSWGLSASITNLYKTLEIFSPNGDGIKDTVELHYRVLEPVHLEFCVYDEKDNLKRSFSKDHPSPIEDLIAWDGRDEQGRVVPDGKYKIKIFDYEFFVEVDDTPPNVNLKLIPLSLYSDIQADLFGHAYDKNLSNWIIELGEGENPPEWREFIKGVDLLVKKDEEGNPILDPIKDTLIEKFTGSEIEQVVGKRLKITAEDFGGNRSTVVSDFLEEIIILSQWDGQPASQAIPGHLARLGLHALEGMETFRVPIGSLIVQYWDDARWLDDLLLINPPSGMININWDNSVLNLAEGYAVRLKVFDALGQEHDSNVLWTADLFDIYKNEQCEIEAKNSLFEELGLIKFQVVPYPETGSTQWVDYFVLDAARGDFIPEGEFDPPLPPTQSGVKYLIRMVGIGESGEEYESGAVDYPPVCDEDKILVELEVTYDEADCGLISNSALLEAMIKGYVNDISVKALSYYLEKPEGLQLLRQFDLTREEWDSVSIDTLNMPEGSYPVKVILTYLDLSDQTDRETSASSTLMVDRVLPAAQMTYPGESMMLCPVKVSNPKGDWYGIPVEGIATDNNGISKYKLYYGIGGNPSEWTPAATRKGDQVLPISGNGPIQGLLGVWDITSLRGETFSLKLKAVDKAGNVQCDTKSFSFDNLVEIVHLSTDKPFFSPNGDGVFDEIEITYEIDEYATVDINVFKLIEAEDGTYGPDSLPLRAIVSGVQNFGGMESASWDGMEDSGAVVPDGLYGIVVFATDSCGNTNLRWTSVEVDNSLPQTIITYPRPPDPIGNIVEVQGTADDLNFKSYLLEVGQGDQPETWLLIASNPTPVKKNILGTWNNSNLDEKWTLRLTATDKVGNKNTTTVTLDLGSRKNLIKDLVANPKLFSPNNDGRLDASTINYELTDACEVTIEILDSSNAVKKTHQMKTFSNGTYSYLWDGKDDAGNLVSDGFYAVQLTAALSSNPAMTQEETITLVVDAHPPLVEIRLPLNGSYQRDPITVLGTISDKHIQEYAVTYTGEGISSLLDQANQNRENYLFGILSEIPEGSYLLEAEAKDLGENVARENIAFSIDRSPPKVTLETPKDSEYYGAEKNAVSVNGGIVEKNLEAFSLRYGSGDPPGQWIDLLTGNTIPSNPQLFSWRVGKNDGVPDGLYTLSLYAKDRAGFIGEAKAKITIDNTPPEIAITSPLEGQYIKTVVDIKGSALDPNLEKYILEVSGGQCGSAFKWAPVKTSTASVNDGLLARWQVLPPDGDYCLRLTGTDKIGNRGEVRIQVKVDTHPPEPPVLSGNVENKADVRLNWVSNNEPDLAGYNVYRGSQKINGVLISASSYLDQNLKEGIFTYFVKAVDLAGNESKPSNELKLTVDLTGPDARIRSPQDGSKVSAFVDIKGTAFSSDDFKQYRISIGQSSNPSSWSTIRTSPVPISYGSLVQWDTLALPEESYSIKLEAEDLSGNINTHQITVSVDNKPPAAPVLISAVPNNSDTTLTWKANTESDLAGYLLYRNDQLANVSGIVIGDLKPYLVTGTAYQDKGLPDGKFKYYVIAMDLAGNLSDPSNSLEVEIDTQSPRATIVEPLDKSKFQNKTMIKAETNDSDIASVQFRYKRSGDSEAMWANLGTAVKQSPYITYIDPIVLGLSFGDYNLRAVATDVGGRTDTTPPSITVTFTDLTSPEPPRQLKTLTNGSDVTLTWAGNEESDLSGYNIYRIAGSTKIRINSSIVTGTTYQDQSLSDNLYTYVATALDTYGNESESSGSASARVYAPNIEQSYTPTGQKLIQISGKNAEPGDSVEMFVGSSSLGEIITDSLGKFTFANLMLSLGENHITAKATDSNGNISRISESVVVVYNEPPLPPTGLNSSVQDYDVALTWDPNAESDLSGYNVYRDGEKLNPPVPVTSGNTQASSSYYPSSRAFDSNSSTYWRPNSSYGTFTPVWWEIELPEPELINHLEIYWGSGIDYEGNEILYAGKDYEIQVWSGYAWVSQVKVTGNNQKENVFDFKPSYRTDRIRIYITDTTDPNYSKQVRISEVGIVKEVLIEEPSYDDTDLDDGEYGYRVTAVDYYGFESEPSVEVERIVGDVTFPASPQNLQAQASDHDVLLTWNPNAETDVAGYNAYRSTPQGWLKLNTALIIGTTYTDANLKNGAYSYRVTAVDSVGNEGLPSTEASTTVSVEPPQPPENLRVSSIPEGYALRAMWGYSSGAVAGYNLYRSSSSGGPYIKINSPLISVMTFFDQGLTNGVTYYYVVTAVDGFGNESGYSNEAMGTPFDQIPPPKPKIFFPTLSGIPIVLYENTADVSGMAEPGSTIELFKDGLPTTTTKVFEEDSIQSFSLTFDGYGFSLSPDGRDLAYTSSGFIWLRDLSTGITSKMVGRGHYCIWSPDGKRLSYQFTDENGIERIGIFDVGTGQHSPLTNDGNDYNEFDPSWSADGRKIAFSRDRGGAWDIWIKDLASGSLTQVTHGSDAYYPNFSPDGKKIAYFDDEGLSLIDILSGETVQIDPNNDLYSLAWSPDSRRLAFASYRNGNSDIFVLDVDTLTQTQVTTTAQDEFTPFWSPNGRNILFTRQENHQAIYVTPSDGQGEERTIKKDIQNLDYLFWIKSGEIAYGDQDQLNIISLEGHFRFEDVVLDSGENKFYVISTDSLGRVSPPSDEISVIFDASQLADLEVTTDDVFIYPASPIAGEEAMIGVFVWNKGEQEARDVDIDVYLWDVTGRLERVGAERISYLAPASAEAIPITWNTTGKIGANQIIVVMDPENNIHELLETNNSATREFFVVEKEGLRMTTVLDSSQYGCYQDVNININIQNSSFERDVVLEVWVEDESGSLVTLLDGVNIQLPYAGEQNYTLVWNTGSIYAGSYRVRVVLKNEPTVVTENLVPFAILPEIDITPMMLTDRTNYDANEDVTLNFSVKNNGRNYAIPELDVKVRIADIENRDLFADDKKIKNILPGSETAMSSIWNIGLQPPGNYHAVVEIYLEGQKISEQSVSFEINASLIIVGQVTVTPSVVFLGNSVHMEYTVENRGNTDISELSVKVRVVDPETQIILNFHEDIVPLLMNSAQTGKAIFSTEGYGLKTYAVNLACGYQGSEKAVGHASFSVKDGTPPVVTILSPSANQYFNSAIGVSAIVTDFASGIDRVEYQLEGGGWKLLPLSDMSQARYSITWSLRASDEGLRRVSVRAVDRAGNTSHPVSVLVTIDLTSPNPPVVLSPLNNAVLSSEVIDITGVAEPGAAVEMAFGSTFKTEADAATGNFSFMGVKLIPGENKFVFRASDRAGNVSSSTGYALQLRIVPEVLVTTDRVEYKLNEVVTITSTIGDPSQYYALQNLVAKLSVMDSQGQILSAEGNSLPVIPVGQEIEWVTTWNTSTHPMGTYAVRLEVLEGEAVLAQSTTSFEIGGGFATWARTYGGKHHDVGYSIRQTAEGGYIVVGETRSFDAGGSDAWVLKLDGSGETEWQKAYGNKHHDVAYSIEQTREGGFIMAGETDAALPFFGDFWVVKLNPVGVIDWQKTFGKGWANSIQQTSEGGYIVAGMHKGDAWVIKLDEDGEIEWQKAFRGMQGDWAHSVKETSDGGYIVAGAIKGDAWVFKLDAQGDIEWQKTYGCCSFDAIVSIEETAEGGYVVASLKSSRGRGHSDVWILKLDRLGNIEWQQAYGGPKHDFAHSIEQTDEGGYIVAGWTQADYDDGLDGWILKLDAFGNIEWQKAYGGHKHDAFHSIQQTSDGGYSVTGWTRSFGEGGLDVWVLKLNSEGDVLDCQEELIEETGVIPYITKASASRSHVKEENTHVCAKECHQSTTETHAIPGDICLQTEPDISINPYCNHIDFGNVRVKQSVTKSCSVSNEGSGDLRIKSVKIIDEEHCPCNPSVFSLRHNCTILLPGSSCEITVQFKPIVPGRQCATLEIYSNDPDENPVTLSLLGKGLKK